MPGNGAAIIAAFIVAIILLLAIPKAVLIAVGLLTIGGFIVYLFNKSKTKDSISARTQAAQKPLPRPARTANPPTPAPTAAAPPPAPPAPAARSAPPPPPPAPIQQTTRPSNQKTPVQNDANESREVASISADFLTGDKPFFAESLQIENAASKEQPGSVETR